MDLRLSFLLSAAIVFVGTHIILTHQLRQPLIALLGKAGFLAAYTIVAFVTLGWAIFAFGTAPRGPYAWQPYSDWAWIAAMVLTYPALLLLIGSFIRNPAAPSPNAEEMAATKEPTGVFAVTRHPMMWGIAIWALSHILLVPEPRTLFLLGSLIVLALVGSAMQDRKKQHQLGTAWSGWQSRTSYFPRPAGFAAISPVMWLGAFALWLLINWLHMPLGGIAAGFWRWLG